MYDGLHKATVRLSGQISPCAPTYGRLFRILLVAALVSSQSVHLLPLRRRSVRIYCSQPNNWTQNPPVATPWRFEPDHRYQQSSDPVGVAVFLLRAQGLCIPYNIEPIQIQLLCYFAWKAIDSYQYPYHGKTSQHSVTRNKFVKIGDS